MNSLVLTTLLLSAGALAAAPTPAIRIDQVGYLPEGPKYAMVVTTAAVTRFEVRSVNGGKTVFSGELGSPVVDENSGDAVRSADFSRLNQPGHYLIHVPELGDSYPFEIGAGVYRQAYRLAMRFFYGQRCGIAVNMGPEFPQFHYDACHLTGAWHSSTGKEGSRESAKGWHDAGDFGRYVVNSGITTGTLLWAWEMFGDRARPVSLQIPESGRSTPDMLSEIRWNLEWMLGMQDTDGGAFHKQTSEKFAGFVMPQADEAISYVIGTGTPPYKGTCATADLAAVMAIAGRVYKPYDAAFASRATGAAERAWRWLEQNPPSNTRDAPILPPTIPFRNPTGVATGEYGDRNCSDERFWAAAELLRTTGEGRYERFFVANYKSFLDAVRPPTWNSVGAMGLWTYLLSSPPTNRRLTLGVMNMGIPQVAESIRKATQAVALEVMDRTNSNPYRTAMRPVDFIWGSNSQAANYGLLLLVANAINPTPGYVEAAQDNLHYLLGRNTFSVSWVTGVGSNWYKHPHHRPSGADGVDEPWPGMLSGGPNRGRADPVLRQLPPNLPAMKNWVDDQESYAGNEVAINWNAPLVFLLAGLLPR
jgi:endoglucanase